MPVQVSYPGVYIEEIPSGVRTITGVATSITAFLGWAAKGPSGAIQGMLARKSRTITSADNKSFSATRFTQSITRFALPEPE